jgi:hypothetical protein
MSLRPTLLFSCENMPALPSDDVKGIRERQHKPKRRVGVFGRNADREPAPAQSASTLNLVAVARHFHHRLTMGFASYFYYFFSIANCIWVPATLLCCIPWVQRQ